jgi:hypothetical protein
MMMRLFLDFGLKVRNLMEKIQFVDIQFTSPESADKGRATLIIDDEKYCFEFHLYDLEIIEKMVDQKTNKVLNFEQILENTIPGLPIEKRKIEVKKYLKDGVFEDRLSDKFGQTLVSLKTMELQKEIKVKFKDFKIYEDNFTVCCDFELFDKRFEMEMLGLTSLNPVRFMTMKGEKIASYPFFLVDSEETEINSYNQWFMEEVNKRGEDNLYYKDNQIQVFHAIYNAKNIIGGILIEKLKSSKEYKMISLYEPILNKIF